MSKGKKKLTGNVGGSTALTLLLLGRRLVLATEGLGVDLRVCDRDDVHVHAATTLLGLLPTDGTTQSCEQDPKDVHVLASAWRSTLLALHVFNNLLEIVRRDVDGHAPRKRQQELDKELAPQTDEQLAAEGTLLGETVFEEYRGSIVIGFIRKGLSVSRQQRGVFFLNNLLDNVVSADRDDGLVDAFQL